MGVCEDEALCGPPTANANDRRAAASRYRWHRMRATGGAVEPQR